MLMHQSGLRLCIIVKYTSKLKLPNCTKGVICMSLPVPMSYLQSYALASKTIAYCSKDKMAVPKVGGSAYAWRFAAINKHNPLIKNADAENYSGA